MRAAEPDPSKLPKRASGQSHFKTMWIGLACLMTAFSAAPEQFNPTIEVQINGQSSGSTIPAGIQPTITRATTVFINDADLPGSRQLTVDGGALDLSQLSVGTRVMESTILVRATLFGRVVNAGTARIGTLVSRTIPNGVRLQGSVEQITIDPALDQLLSASTRQQVNDLVGFLATVGDLTTGAGGSGFDLNETFIIPGGTTVSTDLQGFSLEAIITDTFFPMRPTYVPAQLEGQVSPSGAEGGPPEAVSASVGPSYDLAKEANRTLTFSSSMTSLNLGLTVGPIIDQFFVSGGGTGSTGLNVSINQVLVNLCPQITMVVSVTDSEVNPISGLTVSDFVVKENGDIKSAIVRQVSTGPAFPLSVALVIDTSGSVSGTIGDEKAAAKGLVAQLNPADQVSVFRFSSSVSQELPFTADREAINTAIDGLSSGGSTALFQAITDAAQALGARAGRKAMVVLAGGKNDQSGTVTDAIAAARQAGTPVFMVGFSGADEAVLRRISEETGGVSVISATSADLQRLFEALGRTLTNQYEIIFTGMSPTTTNTVEVTANSGGLSAADTEMFNCSRTPPGTGSCTSVILDIGDKSAKPGETIQVSVAISGNCDPSSFQLDISWDTNRLTYSTVTEGAQLVNAGKTIAENTLNSNTVRIVSSGGQTGIKNGEVALLNFVLAGNSPNGMATEISCSNALSVDAQAQPFPTSCTGGTVTAQSGCDCDLNSDNVVDVIDVQLMINQLLGVISPTCDINSDGLIDVVDLQLDINAALGLGCNP